jgi:hypothetical protein
LDAFAINFGALPLDICAEDDSRGTVGLQNDLDHPETRMSLKRMDSRGSTIWKRRQRSRTAKPTVSMTRAIRITTSCMPARLQRRMIKAGSSKYEPDPAAALSGRR